MKLVLILQVFLVMSNFLSTFAMTKRREKAKAQTSQLNKQLIIAQESSQAMEVRACRKKGLNHWKSELLTDLAKLVFAGVILGGLFEEIESPILLYGVGFTVIIVFLYLGYYFLKREFE